LKLSKLSSSYDLKANAKSKKKKSFRIAKAIFPKKAFDKSTVIPILVKTIARLKYIKSPSLSIV